ncbi:hypothetical protein PO124_17525 [Bacillus licheniformis]|nr:hypothetical protein [Bacillus licheniformis]
MKSHIQITIRFARARRNAGFICSNRPAVFGGKINMLNQPEFHDIDRVKSLLSLIEKEQEILRLFQSTESGITIKSAKKTTMKRWKLQPDYRNIHGRLKTDRLHCGHRTDAHGLLPRRRLASARII